MVAYQQFPTLPQSSPQLTLPLVFLAEYSSLPSLVVSLTQITFIHLGAIYSNQHRPTLQILPDHILPSLVQAQIDNTDSLRPRTRIKNKGCHSFPSGNGLIYNSRAYPTNTFPYNNAFLLRNGHSRTQTQTRSRVLLGSYIS